MTRAANERAGVAVVGGSGYIGAEVLRYVAAHPRLELRWVSARAQAGKRVDDVLPNLAGAVGGKFVSLEEGLSRLDGVEAVFLALPHGVSQKVIPSLVAAAPEKILMDLGADFRTNDLEGYKRYYGHEHRAPDLLPRFVYGLTEFRRRELAGARLIASPGCFATTLNLALAPLAKHGLLSGGVFTTGITGSSGSGNTPVATTHHPERATNVRAYNALKHRHVLEVEAFLRTLTGEDFHVHFVPQSGPFVRGIFATVFAPGVAPERLEAIYTETYRGEPLISVRSGSPELRWVQGTPRAAIGVAGDGEDGVVFCVTDNLGKGGAAQAVQSLNVALGFPETEGLAAPGGFV